MGVREENEMSAENSRGTGTGGCLGTISNVGLTDRRRSGDLLSLIAGPQSMVGVPYVRSLSNGYGLTEDWDSHFA